MQNAVERNYFYWLVHGKFQTLGLVEQFRSRFCASTADIVWITNRVPLSLYMLLVLGDIHGRACMRLVIEIESAYGGPEYGPTGWRSL